MHLYDFSIVNQHLTFTILTGFNDHLDNIKQFIIFKLLAK